MAKLITGTRVTMSVAAVAAFAYPPPSTSLVVAVEGGALKAPANALTTVVAGADTVLAWVGSVDESLLTLSGIQPATATDARALLSRHVLKGSRIWGVIKPGLLRSGHGVADTVYQGDRPWVIIGELDSGAVLAVPLNDIGNGIRGHYQCKVDATHLAFRGSKNSKLELNHVWSFPGSTPVLGSVHANAHAGVTAALRVYFPGR